MSSRYLFRGKRVDNGEWIIGSLIHKQVSLFWIYPHDEAKKFEVMPETVGQCCWTLKDGTNVFKGDRVKVRGTKRVGVYETTIIESRQGFTLEENKTYANDDACFLAILEVIGSIHD